MNCIHNVWINCGEIHDCSTCGWDPEVAQRRKENRAGRQEAKPKAPEAPPKRVMHSDDEVRRIVMENHVDFGGTMNSREISEDHHIDNKRVCRVRREIALELAAAVKIG